MDNVELALIAGLNHQQNVQAGQIADIQAWQRYQARGLSPEEIIIRERENAEYALAQALRERRKTIWAMLVCAAMTVFCCFAFKLDRTGANEILECFGIFIFGFATACCAFFSLSVPRLQKSYCWKMAEMASGE